MSERVLLVGSFGPGALEKSYAHAFTELGYDVERFAIDARIDQYCRGGRGGRFFNRFVPVERWVRKASRELLVLAMDIRPSVVVVFGQNLVAAGTLAQLHAGLPAVQSVLVWPDSLNFLGTLTATALPAYDVVASYSRAALDAFHRLGARRAIWLPLAADPGMHGVAQIGDGWDESLAADVSFVGSWQPERERVLERLVAELQQVDIRIYGSDWGRRCRNQEVLRRWRRRSLWEGQFRACIASSRVSLNIIDPTNYPAANMRFFEIPCAGGVQVSTACPEMAEDFPDGEAVLYRDHGEDIARAVRDLLQNDQQRQRLAARAHELVMQKHTYLERVRELMRVLGECKSAAAG